MIQRLKRFFQREQSKMKIGKIKDIDINNTNNIKIGSIEEVEITKDELNELFERDLTIILGMRPRHLTEESLKNATNTAFKKLDIPLEVKTKATAKNQN